MCTFLTVEEAPLVVKPPIIVWIFPRSQHLIAWPSCRGECILSLCCYLYLGSHFSFFGLFVTFLFIFLSIASPVGLGVQQQSTLAPYSSVFLLSVYSILVYNTLASHLFVGTIAFRPLHSNPLSSHAL